MRACRAAGPGLGGGTRGLPRPAERSGPPGTGPSSELGPASQAGPRWAVPFPGGFGGAAAWAQAGVAQASLPRLPSALANPNPP
jgi:hypothetical protein